MPADVIEVDFEASRRARLPLDERAEELQEEISAIRVSIENELAWLERQRYLERRRVRELEQALERERAANFPFSDDEVLAAFRALFVGTPLAAKTVAAALYGREATHSAVVRAGLALHRLSATGDVEAAVPPTRREATRWAPTEADDA
jgi:uncharacterized protein YhaN